MIIILAANPVGGRSGKDRVVGTERGLVRRRTDAFGVRLVKEYR